MIARPRTPIIGRWSTLACKKSTWGRLLPKHSHNFADRVNSMVKEVIWPQRGTGGGCAAPWDFEDVMKQALKTQTGTKDGAPSPMRALRATH